VDFGINSKWIIQLLLSVKSVCVTFLFDVAQLPCVNRIRNSARRLTLDTMMKSLLPDNKKLGCRQQITAVFQLFSAPCAIDRTKRMELAWRFGTGRHPILLSTRKDSMLT